MQRVHNLTVDDLHTYYVVAGDTPVLSHNCAAKRGDSYDEGGFERSNSAKGNTPRNNQAQNKAFKDAVREIENTIGRKLTKSEQRKLHEEITGQGYGYHEIVEEGKYLFG